MSQDWLDELVSRALQSGVGAVGCRLLYEDGTLQHAGFVARETADDFLTHEGVGEEGSEGGYLGRHALVHETSAVTGACIAVRRELFQALGGFDAVQFPIDGNDVDFCFRVRDAGYSVIYTPYATLYHLKSKTRGYGATEAARDKAQQSLARLWEMWSGKFTPDPYYNRHFDRTGQPFSRLRPPLESRAEL
ncbi:glycosyltransferase [Brevundimonas sp. SORGH_AS_0993]|uniref:glycosyltransferase family 2 protein n=1 Tax=Brevundimonas sp. SORGH_AS_0993 TaxID=3041794 RepID=UPI0035946B80